MNSLFAIRLTTVGMVLLAVLAAPGAAQVSREVVVDYLWPATPAARASALELLRSDASATRLDRDDAARLEEWIRLGPDFERAAGVGDVLHDLVVEAPGGREVPTLVRLPSGYTPDRAWPLMLAMHGGPPGSVEGALRGALNMVSVWAAAADSAGWIVASPAMVDVVSRDGRTQDRLPYEIFQPEEAKAVVDAVRARYRVDPDMIVSTGISLGSNFSIAYGAGHPDRFSAIVPVSTEGESREHLLRNLASVPTYVLEGAQDQNIRGVNGPRALNAIMTRLGYDLVYREFADRAHEGFSEHYPDVLDWLEERPRHTAPTGVLRVPHAGIVPVSRHVHWVESNTRQGVVRARVTEPGVIEITARWADSVTLLLNDHLVDLDQPVTVNVNGVRVFEGRLARSARTALDEVARSGDNGRVFTAVLRVAVPDSPSARARGEALVAELAPEHAEGVLSFWEMYAVRALEERFPSVGFTGEEIPIPDGVSAPAEHVGLRVDVVEPGSVVDRAGLERGDVLVRFGGEPFYAGRADVERLHHWLLRELRSTPAEYELRVLRDGTPVTLTARLGLGPYRPPGN